MSVSRVHRLLRLIILLQSGRARTVRELMEDLGVSRRTLFRDLNMLEMAGIPYYHEPGQGYRVAQTFFLPPVNLTVVETLGLMLMGKQAEAQRQQPLAEPALTAIDKLTSTVPEPIRSACHDLMRHVSVQTGPKAKVNGERAFYATLQECIDQSQRCRVEYHSPVEPQPMHLELAPYALHFASRAWYLFAHSFAHREVRIFKLVRIKQLEPTRKTFRRPRTWTIARKLGSAWQLIPEGKTYDVELLFAPKVARNVSEVLWHPSQSVQMEADGSSRMTFRVDGLGEIAWWVCGYADQVKVIRPVALRQRVREMFLAAAESQHF